MKYCIHVVLTSENEEMLRKDLHCHGHDTLHVCVLVLPISHFRNDITTTKLSFYNTKKITFLKGYY